MYVPFWYVCCQEFSKSVHFCGIFILIFGILKISKMNVFVSKIWKILHLFGIENMSIIEIPNKIRNASLVTLVWYDQDYFVYIPYMSSNM